jgi:ATP-dependent Clp protease ATP-binding subunit ClpX
VIVDAGVIEHTSEPILIYQDAQKRVENAH